MTITTDKAPLNYAELEQLPVFNVKEVSQLLRITPDTVRDDIRAGILKAENYGSGQRPVYRIPRAALDEWRASRTVKGTAQGQK